MEMKMILFFDTETSGVPKNYKRNFTDVENWPRLVQLGYIKTDNNLNILDSKEYLVKPSGFVIPAEVSRVHGIIHDEALENGLDLEYVLDVFSKELFGCSLLVGHNINYDLNVVGAEFIRCGMYNPLIDIPFFCTMKAGINETKIPGKYGYKWPKLDELYYHYFQKPIEKQHTALADVEATLEVYRMLPKVGDKHE